MERCPLILTGTGFDPYYNLAVEEVLAGFAAGRKVLYLWQNDKTIVVGRNQDIRSECDVDMAESLGVHLTRRISGGGAVYHDLGNLNFTFAGSEAETDIIVDAIRSLGLNVQVTGRNDIELVTDRTSAKFSGNAYYKSGSKCFHHGTILLDTDFAMMSKFLTPPATKLESHGVKSVRSRVINLKEVMPELTVDRVKSAIIESFEDKYGKAETMDITSLDAGEIETVRERLISAEWIYGS